MKTIGGILIVLGIVLLLIRSFSYVQKDKVAQIGPVEINANEKKTVSWPVYAGGIAIIAGVVFVLVDRRSKSL